MVSYDLTAGEPAHGATSAPPLAEVVLSHGAELESAVPMARRVAAGPVLAYQTPSRDQREGLKAFDVLEGSRGRHFYFPLALVAFGIVTLPLWALWGPDPAAGLADVLKFMGFYAVWNVGLMLLGIVISAWLLDTYFGTVWQAMLKIAAIALGSGGVQWAIALLISGLSGEVIGFFIGVPVYWWLIGFLFELDFRETFICVVVITLLKMVAVWAFWMWI